MERDEILQDIGRLIGLWLTYGGQICKFNDREREICGQFVDIKKVKVLEGMCVRRLKV